MFTAASSSKITTASADRVASGYATCADFCKVFSDGLDRLYMLALLLIPDCAMAEHCFLSAFEECLGSKTVFKEWAYSWAKRTTIMTAIRIVFGSQTPADDQVRAESFEDAMSGMDILVARMSNLPPFDRFVYVLSVLERISDKECSLLLNCSVHEVMDARARSLQSTSHLPRQKHANHERGSVENSTAAMLND